MPLFGISAVSKNDSHLELRRLYGCIWLVKKSKGQAQAPAHRLPVVLNHCHTLVLPWSVARGMGQGLGNSKSRVTHFSHGVDETTSGLLPSRSYDPHSCPADSAPGTPLCTFCDPPMGLHCSSPQLWGGRGYTGYSNQAATHGPCSISTDIANINSL